MAPEHKANSSDESSSLGEFGSQLVLSSLLSSRQKEELRQKLESGRWPSTPRELASRLVHERWLTEFQAKRLLAGKGNELVVGRYTILDRIGSGAMGRVYRAQHQLMGRVVALKVIAPELMSNERVISRFLREMRLVARLDHPNVVRAFDADRIDGLFFIAMEYVPGKSLGDLLRKGTLPAVDVIRYAAQAALGLGHAHDQGILHRDVKPSNLLLTKDRKTLKVLDLGLGTLMELDPDESFRTADGIAVGTVDYMSPEQASGKPLDGRSDLYSLACCMYHLMTGQCPFQHENPINRLAMRIQGQPTPIQNYLPDLPSRVVNVINKMMATRPQDRYQTGAEASEALLALLKKKPRPDKLGGADSSEASLDAIAQREPESEFDQGFAEPELESGAKPQVSAKERSASQKAFSKESGSNLAIQLDSMIPEPDMPWVLRHPTIAISLVVISILSSFLIGFFLGRIS